MRLRRPLRYRQRAKSRLQLQAIALVAAHDYGKLNVKDTRLDVLTKQLYQRSIQVKKRQLNEEENKTCQRFASAVMEIWEEEEKKSNGKA